MSKRIVLAAFLCLAYADARAEVIEISLPEFQGSYVYQSARGPERNDPRQVSFDLGGPITQVNGAWIRWSGSVAAGWGSGPSTGLFRWVGSIYARLDPSHFGDWTASVHVESPTWERDFDATQSFVSLAIPGWEFLYDGIAVVEVGVTAASYLAGEMISPPTATIGDATLILDVTFATTPVESSTWGRVKSLYRR